MTENPKVPFFECETETSTLYSNCLTFNLGCYLYYLSQSKYVPVNPGIYSDGTKCANVLQNGYIDSWANCPTIYAITKIKDCQTGTIQDSGSNIPVAYGYFVFDPSYTPHSGWWYRDTNCTGNELNDFCTIYYIYPATSITSANTAKPLLYIDSTEYDQGGVNGANVCAGIAVTPTPTPTVTPTNTVTPTYTPTPTPTEGFTISYSFTNTATAGTFSISKNGNQIVYLSSGGSGNFNAYSTDTIYVYSYTTSDGVNTAYNGMTIVDDGNTVFNNSASDPLTATNSYSYTPSGDGSITVNAYEF